MGRIGLPEIFVLFVIVFIYFLPTVIGMIRKKSNRGAIFLLNLFLGWTFIGWIVSLVWACTSDKNQTIIVNNSFAENNLSPTKTEDKLDSIKKLKELLDSSTLTQSEFDEQKAKILSI